MKKKISMIIIIVVIGISISPMFLQNKENAGIKELELAHSEFYNKELPYCITAIQYSDELLATDEFSKLYNVETDGTVSCYFYVPSKILEDIDNK